MSKVGKNRYEGVQSFLSCEISGNNRNRKGGESRRLFFAKRKKKSGSKRRGVKGRFSMDGREKKDW